MHLDVYTQYVKLAFYQPFENQQNIFRQVGIVSLLAIGEPLRQFEEAVGHDRFAEGNIQFPQPNINRQRDQVATLANVQDA